MECQDAVKPNTSSMEMAPSPLFTKKEKSNTFSTVCTKPKATRKRKEWRIIWVDAGKNDNCMTIRVGFKVSKRTATTIGVCSATWEIQHGLLFYLCADTLMAHRKGDLIITKNNQDLDMEL